MAKTTPVNTLPPLCAVCGRSMTDPVTKSSYIGTHFDFGAIDVREAFNRVYPELVGKQTEYAVCFVCWLKALRVNIR